LQKAPSGFWPFLEDFWWPLVEDRLDHDMINAATNYRCATMLKSGVTSFYDCTEAPNALPGCLFSQSDVVRKWGLRGILSFEATQRISGENGLMGLQENADFVRANRQSLITGLICHHTTFTCSADFIQQAYGIAQDLGVLLHAHVSEGTYEPEHLLKNYGMRTLPYYDQLGVAGEGFLASQCVQIEAEEIALMAERGVRMTHMPLSNCEVGGGIAPVPELIEAGVTVGLGSDGYVDDFFEIMRGAFLIHKAKHQDPQVMPAHLVWHLATEGGAKALGFEKVGRIEPGWQADLQLINIDLPTPVQEHNLFEQMLLYRNAENVRGVLAAGEVKVKNGEVLNADWDQLHAHTREAAKRLWTAV
jgi:cytosine/adenosine deaminase-related metal-dependent hydrolase